MISDLGERVESVDSRKYLATLFGQKGFGRSANGLAVVDNKDFEAAQRAGCVT
jgi:hypothetical protein